MYAVLYTQQLEPITVILLRPYLWRMLLSGQRVRLPIVSPVTIESMRNPLSVVPLRCAEIWGEPLRRRDHEALMVFCDDEELALALRSDLLPGQRKDQQDDQRRQFARGFFYALEQYRE